MILKNRYHEALKTIEVTPEIHHRIMQNISHMDFEGFSQKVRPLKRNRQYFSMAACLAILLVGIWVIPNMLSAPLIHPPVQVIPDIVVCDSVERLSEVVDFAVGEVQELHFAVEEVRYTAYWKKLAEILYTGQEDTLLFRMSVGDADNSGDYTEYADVKSLPLKDFTVTLKGENSQYALAVWAHDGFAYSLKLSTFVDEEEMMKILQSLEAKEK